MKPNETLHATGAALLVRRAIKVLQAAPAGELWRSADTRNVPISLDYCSG